MHALTAWFIRNPVAANLIMALILIGGFVTLSSLRIEGFPKLPPNSIKITTAFSNAHTHQIDKQITQKIEKALEGLDGVKKTTSVTINGLSEVQVQKNESHSLQKMLDDIRIRIDAIPNLPKASGKPVVTLNKFDFPAMYIMVDGQTDAKTLQKLVQVLNKALLARPEISRSHLLGEKQSEILIETDPIVLERYGLSPREVSEKIEKSSLLFQFGTLKTKNTHISLRADSQAYYKTDFERIPIIDNIDGTRVLLGDIAKITDTYADDDVIVRFNGKDATGLKLLIGRKENLLVIAKAVHKVIADIRPQFPPDVNISIFGDSSVYISERLDLLKSNAFQGLIIVLVLLALFLNTKLAFWVAMGIPISIAGTIALMGTKWIDYSLNDITTFGMIIALGILVDDAVVVGESVFSERKKHKNAFVGTEVGVKRVATATIFGVLTTIAAFSPMLMINNELGKVLSAFSGIVIMALLFSLFESKFILPAHLAQIKLTTKTYSKTTPLYYLSLCQSSAQNGLSWFKHKVYAPVLFKSIKHRYAVVIAFVSLIIISVGLVANGKIKSVFIPEVPGQIISIRMEMDARAPYRLTVDNMEKIERVAENLNAEYLKLGEKQPPIKDVLKVVTGAYKGEIYAQLTPTDQRPNLSTVDIAKQWQTQVGTLEGSISLEFTATEDVGGGFAVQIFSKDEQALSSVSHEIQNYLLKIRGVKNLRDGLKGGQPEISLKLKPEAYNMGFSAQDLAIQIGNRFGRSEVQRFQRDSQEVKVILQNTRSSRETIDSLMQTRLRNAQGQWLPISAIATFDSLYSQDYIERRNGKRVNTIEAYIDKSIVSPSEISQGLFSSLVPGLKQRFPNVDIKPAGELEEISDMHGGLKRALLIAAVLIYMLMAIPLKSYWQPFIIMSVVPFGFIGAAIGHFIMNVPLSLLSFFGMLALTGIVVNDSLVMMTRYNDSKRDGQSIHDALQSAGVGRYQAIFLTTVTTVAGLLPLIFETSEQAQYLIPAAISLAYGEIFATTITLILIPVLIAITEDIKGAVKHVLS